MATSVRKENRWRRQLYAQNSAVSDRLREIEIPFVARQTVQEQHRRLGARTGGAEHDGLGSRQR